MKLGSVNIDIVDKVDKAAGTRTTDHALEEGEPITDHVESDPNTLSISGIIKDLTETKRKTLEKYMKDGTLLSFSFATKLSNVIITSFSTTNDSRVKGGYSFTMSLKQVKLAKTGKNVAIKKPVALRTTKTKNTGRKAVKKL